MKSICKIKGCKRPVKSRGWCKPHYIRWWRRGGDPAVRMLAAPGKQLPCKVRGCKSISRANGLCHMHAERLRITGRIGPAKKLIRDFGSGCIIPAGYKVIGKNGKHFREHRLVMERKLKRKLTPHEIVHHKNEVKLDNREKNLQVMTRAEHERHHNPRKGKGAYRSKRP